MAMARAWGQLADGLARSSRSARSGLLCVDGSMVTLSCGAYVGTGRRRDQRPHRRGEHERGADIVPPPCASSPASSPPGRKHLGNYIGAITPVRRRPGPRRPAIYCIVDLHAITVPYDPAELRERVYDTTAILLAAGLDPERCILFRQGDVREHTELTWLLSA